MSFSHGKYIVYSDDFETIERLLIREEIWKSEEMNELPSCFASRSPFFLAKAGEGLGVGWRNSESETGDRSQKTEAGSQKPEKLRSSVFGLRTVRYDNYVVLKN
jgi:hypothetical protein